MTCEAYGWGFTAGERRQTAQRLGVPDDPLEPASAEQMANVLRELKAIREALPDRKDRIDGGTVALVILVIVLMVFSVLGGAGVATIASPLLLGVITIRFVMR